MMQKPLMIFIVGTTAVGKTKLSIQLCKAIGGQIINCDSKQLYKYANIMTAKATQEQMQGVPHHMLDILDLHQNCYNRNKYFTQAIKCVNDIKARGKVPVVVGGTNYYLETLLYDINIRAEDGGESNEQQEKQTQQEKKESEGEALKQTDPDRITKQQIASMSKQQKYAYLKKVDSVMGQKLHPNDETRITRFLQRYSETGIPPSTTYKPYEHKLRFDNSVLFWIRNSDKNELHDLMRNRIGKMVDEEGLIQIISIFKYAEMRGLSEELNMGSLQSIGYKEFKEVYDSIKQTLSDEQFNNQKRQYPEIEKYVRANIKQLKQKIDKIEANSVHSDKRNRKTTLLQKCIEVLNQNTIEYSRRQVTWIKNRIFACENNRTNFFVLELGNKHRMNKNLMVRFEQNVKSRALGILNQIKTNGMGSVKEELKQFTLNKHESLTQWKKYKCQDCGIEVNGTHEWNEHLNSKKHKRLLSNKGKKMFFQKKKEEAVQQKKEQDKNSNNDSASSSEQDQQENNSKPRKIKPGKEEKQSEQK